MHYVANVVHRDIKPDNILVDKNERVKIADFGVSTLMENNEELMVADLGTKYFQAPEIFLNKPYRGRMVDIWALGVSFYYLATAEYPFKGKTVEELKNQIFSSE